MYIFNCYSWWVASSTWSWTLWSRTRRTSATCWSCSTIVRPVCRSVQYARIAYYNIYISFQFFFVDRIQSPLRPAAFPFLMPWLSDVRFCHSNSRRWLAAHRPKTYTRINNEADLCERESACSPVGGDVRLSLILHCARCVPQSVCAPWCGK